MKIVYCLIWVDEYELNRLWIERFSDDLESFAFHAQRNEVNVIDVIYCSTKNVELVDKDWLEWWVESVLVTLCESNETMIGIFVWQQGIERILLQCWICCSQEVLITILRL